MTNTDILMEIRNELIKANEKLVMIENKLAVIGVDKAVGKDFTAVAPLKQEENLFNPAEVKASLPKRTYNKKKNL